MLSRLEQVLVGTAYQIGELGKLHDLPAGGAEEFGALAVDEQVGLAPGEHNSWDRGGEDELRAAARS